MEDYHMQRAKREGAKTIDRQISDGIKTEKGVASPQVRNYYHQDKEAGWARSATVYDDKKGTDGVRTY